MGMFEEYDWTRIFIALVILVVLVAGILAFAFPDSAFNPLKLKKQPVISTDTDSGQSNRLPSGKIDQSKPPANLKNPQDKDVVVNKDINYQDIKQPAGGEAGPGTTTQPDSTEKEGELPTA